MEDGTEEVEAAPKNKNIYDPLMYHVLVNLVFVILTFIRPEFGLLYTVVAFIQGCILALLFLINIFTKPTIGGIYLLALLSIFFMYITTIYIACGGSKL